MNSVRLLLSAAILLVSSFAYAGAFKIAPVTIFDNGETGNAGGNLIAARFSDNEYERIGCAVASGDNGPYAYCEASLDADDDGGVYCITYDASMINAIASINTLSYVYFEWKFDGVNKNLCTHVTVATRSIHIPSKFKP